MASASLPEFYDYEEISGHKFWDGGILSNTPIRELIQAHKDFWEYKTGSKELENSILEEVYENWLMENAKEVFEDKVKKYSKKLGVLTNQIVIKNLKNRWGSLTKNGVLNLNLNLIKAPENVIDYVILHELCHLKIKEHSHHYWGLLHKYMPNYHDKVEWLKINGKSLL